MITTDKMGSFTDARFIHTNDVETFYIKNGKAKLVAKTDQAYQNLQFVKNGVSAIVTSVSDRLGLINDVSVNIRLKNNLLHDIIPFNKCLLLLTTPTGEVYIYGTPQFPLSCVKSLETSSEAAGFSGEVLMFSGKQNTLPALML